MKKLLTIVAASAMFAIVACGPSAEEKKAETTDTTAVAPADTMPAMEATVDTTAAAVDTAAAATEAAPATK